jgi:aspartate/methionine/tyrosine aminotransferase
MTGWRVGWMIGPSDVMKAAINFQSHTTSNISNVSQVAALAAVSGDLSAVTMMRDAFERRGRVMHQMLSAIPGVTCLAPQGAFYCYPNVSGLLGRPLGPGGTVSRTSMELRHGRRRHGRRHPPHRRVRRPLNRRRPASLRAAS